MLLGQNTISSLWLRSSSVSYHVTICEPPNTHFCLARVQQIPFNPSSKPCSGELQATHKGRQPSLRRGQANTNSHLSSNMATSSLLINTRLHNHFRPGPTRQISLNLPTTSSPSSSFVTSMRTILSLPRSSHLLDGNSIRVCGIAR